MKTLLVILGPTGVGKTALSLAIAQRLGVDIINADSRQLFRELPIGTAAPTADEQRLARHHFVGTLSITDYYSAARYEDDVLALLQEMFCVQGRDIALLSGGSMMYIDAVCKGIDDIPNVKTEVRDALKRRYAEEGIGGIDSELARLDPSYHAAVDRSNPKRLIHALEVCLSTGKPYSSFLTDTRKSRPFRTVKIGLTRERSELYNRIDRRVDQMMANGLLHEARSMYAHRTLNALNTVGYKELFAHLDGQCTLEEAVAKIKFNTHKYCRKQLTWFRRDDTVRWFSPDDEDGIMQYINDAISGNAQTASAQTASAQTANDQTANAQTANAQTAVNQTTVTQTTAVEKGEQA